MIVEQIWTANAGRNFNYLIACAETGEALASELRPGNAGADSVRHFTGRSHGSPKAGDCRDAWDGKAPRLLSRAVYP